MLTQFQNSLRSAWREVFNPVTTPEPQIPLSWARRIGAYEAVPESYREFFEPLQKAGQSFPYCVLTPSFAGFLHPTSEKLICDEGEEIHVLEKKGGRLQDTCYPRPEIIAIEHRKVLLDSHIKVSGMIKGGMSGSSTLRFNTATEHLFEPLLGRMRGGSSEYQDPGTHPDAGKFLAWMERDYKFMMLARRSLMADEKVLFFHLQPEMRTPRVKLLSRKFYRIISRTHAVILTDREIILIWEEGWYGGTREYLPISKVEAVTLEKREKDLLELCISMKEGIKFTFLYPSSAREEIKNIVENARNIISK